VWVGATKSHSVRHARGVCCVWCIMAACVLRCGRNVAAVLFLCGPRIAVKSCALCAQAPVSTCRCWVAGLRRGAGCMPPLLC
jgi:hypothetical protein